LSDKLSKIRFTAINGDIYFIYKEYCLSDWIVEDRELDEKEAKRVSKLEASKPLKLNHI